MIVAGDAGFYAPGARLAAACVRRARPALPWPASTPRSTAGATKKASNAALLGRVVAGDFVFQSSKLARSRVLQRGARRHRRRTCSTSATSSAWTWRRYASRSRWTRPCPGTSASAQRIDLFQASPPTLLVIRADAEGHRLAEEVAVAAMRSFGGRPRRRRACCRGRAKDLDRRLPGAARTVGEREVRRGFAVARSRGATPSSAAMLGRRLRRLGSAACRRSSLPVSATRRTSSPAPPAPRSPSARRVGLRETSSRVSRCATNRRRARARGRPRCRHGRRRPVHRHDVPHRAILSLRRSAAIARGRRHHPRVHDEHVTIVDHEERAAFDQVARSGSFQTNA